MTISPSVLSPSRLFPSKLFPKGLGPLACGQSKPGQTGHGMLIAIDANVDGHDALAAGAIAGARVTVLNAKSRALIQITNAIHRFPDTLQSLHIVTHGSPGCLHFSSGNVTSQNLHTYAEHIESWFSYTPLNQHSNVKIKNPNSFLSLYACNLASGNVGTDFIENLHYLAGVSVHASQRRVSSTALNGSWQLEVAYPFPKETKFPFTDDLLGSYRALV